jgi:MoaA/NifB/PqqE/SkfB family radical SAM enzyme
MNDKDRLLMYYLGGRLYMPKPRYLCFNATLRCDGRCSHCGIWKDKNEVPEISAPQLKEILSSSFFSKIETAWITGGEPTIREDIGRVTETLADSLSSITTLGIATNGLVTKRALERSKDMISAVSGKDLKLFFHISLDGVGQLHDKVRNIKGAFDSVSSTIEGLKELQAKHPDQDIEIGLNCVMQPENIDGLDDLYQHAKDIGLNIMFNVALVTDQVYRNKDFKKDLDLSGVHKEKIISFLDKITPGSPLPFQYQYNIIKEVLSGKKRPNRCLTLYSTVNINADGALIPCPASSDKLPVNITEENIEEVWDSDKARKMRKMVCQKLCPTCMLSCSLGDSMPLGEYLKGWE